MGAGMAKNLLSGGFAVYGYDTDHDKVTAIIEAGGRKIDTPDQLAAQVDIIILSLPNSHIVDDVVRNLLKLFKTAKKRLILIDMTTADPLMSESLAQQLREKGIEMLDATISGTPKMCAARDIMLMVGGDESVYQKCGSIFNTLANKTFYLGKNGSGAMMKLIVNLVLGLNRMVLAEGLALGGRSGMDQERLLEVLKESAAYSKAMDMKGRKMIKSDFLPAEGKLAFHLKDVRLMLDLANRLNFPLILSSMHAQALASQVAKGHGEWDNAAIIAFYNELANN
jgi:3-hydroxyisobutyrate dehydrogenase-like beta-hydroxyacid dehydrogenase